MIAVLFSSQPLIRSTQRFTEKCPYGLHAMNLWIAIGLFLLGAGFGALTTLMLFRKRIRDFGKSAETERKSA
jgi:hypothetical protein